MTINSLYVRKAVPFGRQLPIAMTLVVLGLSQNTVSLAQEGEDTATT